jgi:hypothetical protein
MSVVELLPVSHLSATSDRYQGGIDRKAHRTEGVWHRLVTARGSIGRSRGADRTPDIGHQTHFWQLLLANVKKGVLQQESRERENSTREFKDLAKSA